MLMEHKCRYLLVILLCICSSIFALGQSKNPTEPASHTVQLVAAPRISNQPEGKSLESAFGFVQEEPLAILLCGLVLFAGATTLRRKRSANREQTPESIETSV